MGPTARILLIASLLTLPLGGCESFNFDPADWLAGELFTTKKPLPGVRKPVFPDGVPGVVSGIPPELMKGNQQQQVAGGPSSASAMTQEGAANLQTNGQAATDARPAAQASHPQAGTPVRSAAVEPQAEPKAKRKTAVKPRVKRKAKPKPTAIAKAKATAPKSDPAPDAVWPPPPRQQAAQQVQWPDPPAQQPAQQVQWPDPPASPQ